MKKPAYLSRRSLAAALPLAALAGSLPEAAAAVPTGFKADADATLLDLGQQWLASHVKHVAHWRAWQRMPNAERELNNAALDAECEAMSLHEWSLEDRIHAIPSTTLAGLAVKARIVAHEHDVEDLEIASIEEARALAQHGDSQAHAALSLALDILKLAGPAA